MVKILACPECQKLDTFPLHSTYRNLIYGCSHEIKKLDEEIRAARPLPMAPRQDMECITIIKHVEPIMRENRYIGHNRKRHVN